MNSQVPDVDIITVINFIMPVRHHDTVKDWDGVVRRMSHTMASLAAQTNPNWRVTIVANPDTPLPDLPPQADVVHVDFAPAHLPNEFKEPEAFYHAIRLEKGSRIERGMLAMRAARYTMVMDYDDFLHRDLVAFVAGGNAPNGWTIEHGYFFDGGPILYKTHDEFSAFCGSSHIVRSNLYLPISGQAPYDQDYVKRALGSHRAIVADLRQAGTPLDILPFAGAVYRMGYRGNTSSSRNIRKWLFGWTTSLGHPLRTIRRLSRLRRMTPAIERDYFAGDYRLGL
jgi:hypothetical protein